MSTPQTRIDSETDVLTPADAAKLLRVSRATFFKMDSAGKIPLAVHLTPRCPRWLRSELLDWLAAGAPSRQEWEKLKSGGKR
jgi:predicted DNA-binding transcriptional regulator AlpA